MSYTIDTIKNVSIAGHGGTGKTTLFERLLFTGGVIHKPEATESGKTVSDSSPEEIERKISIHAALAHIERNGKKLNFFDTPGSSDFTGDVILTFRSAESVLLTIDGRSGAQIETVKLWRNLGTRNKPRGIFVTYLDDDRTDFNRVLADIKDKFKVIPIPFTLPMGTGAAFKGVIDVLNEKAYSIQKDALEKEVPIPDEYKDSLAAAREHLVEGAAEGDDELMDKYLENGTLDTDEVHRGLIEALANNKIVPLFAGAILKNSGLVPLLNAVADVFPSPKTAKDVIVGVDGTQKDVSLDPNKPLSGLVIKTVYDQFSGKLSWIKVITGTLSSDSEIFNVTENKKERVGKLFVCQGRKLEEIREICTGDIGIIAKSASLKTNDTILSVGTGDTSGTFLPLRLPEPVHSVAVNAIAKKDEDKLGEALIRAAEEDLTLKYSFNSETKEAVVSGMGELHVNMILDKIKAAHKIDVETHIPRVPYRETITKKSTAEYTHKKQTGGHGQYGKVLIEIAPLPRGENYQFINAIFGGSVPKNYIPGVEKGIAEGMARGVMAGYPVVDVEVKLVDGKYHPVDSSELSFKLASRNAFREAMKLAGPTLLEPIVNLTVFVEDKYLGDVMSDLSSKRGKILGQDTTGGIDEIRAQVPQAELLRYSIDLRSITSGTGSFTVEFDHYAPISGKIAEDVIKAAIAFKVQDEEE
ncbi:MAG: elongation factor G [Treponema sp.]|jgi:elongation factor G|nr:elongation factor G [Treponema sp.]